MKKNVNLSEKEKNKEQNLEILKKLRPIDDDFMRCIFKDNIELTQVVLRIILGKKDLVVESVKTQADMKRLVGARSLCLDVYGTDSTGKIYDIEVQRADKGTRPKRARYHSSVIDVENLDVNQDFEQLPESYVIFITENDAFRKGLPLYRIERVNIDSKDESFDDGQHIIYVNGKYRGNDEIGNLMHDFLCSNPHEMYNKELKDTTIKFKEKEGKDEMCEIIEKAMIEREKRGEKKGISKGRILEFFEICVTELNMSNKDEILKKVISKYSNLTQQQAEEFYLEAMQNIKNNQ